MHTGQSGAVLVEPTDGGSVLPVDGKDLVTLVTCTPIGVDSHRNLVTGERVIPTPQEDLEDAGRSPEIPTFPWWILAAGGVLVAAGVYVWLAGRPTRRDRDARAEVDGTSAGR